MKEKLDDLNVDELLVIVDAALFNYSTYFVDWEELYNNPKYRPEYPKDLNEAIEAVKVLKRKNIPQPGDN